ncbi:MAG: FAD-binding oxidoreductase [Chloroflexota bacterium]|nr:FAD-binding oxidoreductase [Chloroflexota bacterium]
MAIEERASSVAQIDDAAVEALRAVIRGTLLRPGDTGYDAARKVFNAMIDKRPALILRCAGAADVIHGVNFARTHGLLLSVRGGGHSVAGKAVCDGGLMLDLSPMKGVRVDPTRRTAEAQPGLLLRDLDHETQAFGLATPLGVVSVTGIAGLTLGGGIGWLNGKYGLACDNVLSADVVTADGRLLTASADEHADLYWGIRGGSGNFGLVTSFRYQLHPVGPVLAGGVVHSFSRAREVLRFYREFAGACPDELSTVASIGTGPDGSLVVAVAVCYCGDLEAGERTVRPLRTFGHPLEDGIQAMPYCTLQSAGDAGFPPDRQHYWRSGWLTDLSEDAIDVILRFAAAKPSPATPVGLQQLHGAASRVDPTATAFPHRAQQYELLILSQWADSAESAKNVEWTRAFFDAMQPFLGRGVYVNDLGEEGEDRVRAAYGTNYERLVAVKNKYDPTNLFRANHNIKPTVVRWPR